MEQTAEERRQYLRKNGEWNFLWGGKYETQKEYYDNDPEYREKRKQQWREYAKKNKARTSARAKERITCECGANLARSSKRVHISSNKHQIFLQREEEMREGMEEHLNFVSSPVRENYKVVILNDGSTVSTTDPEYWNDRCRGCDKREFNCRCGSAGYN